MHTARSTIPIVGSFAIAAFLHSGCSPADPLSDSRAPAGSVWGPAVEAELLRPFQGTWSLNAEVTGDPRIDPDDSKPAFKPVDGTEIRIDGHIVIKPGLLEGEYRLFLAHDHDGWVCARAWHHEDRHDPGDMSKCHVKLKIEQGQLRMNIRWPDRGAHMDDPDLVSSRPVISAKAGSCPLTSDFDYGWSDWMSFVYDRADD